jgi:hypothetical protein
VITVTGFATRACAHLIIIEVLNMYALKISQKDVLSPDVFICMSPEVLFLRTFCHAGCLIFRTFCPSGRFVLVLDVMSPAFMSPNVLCGYHLHISLYTLVTRVWILEVRYLSIILNIGYRLNIYRIR